MPSGNAASKRNGFTLIELLVVMAVLGLLASLVAPRYFKQVDRAREAALRQQLAATRDAIDKFRADAERYPSNLQELVDRRYLRSIPVDPLTERVDSWVLVPPAQGQSGVFDLRSGAPGNSSDGKPYASW